MGAAAVRASAIAMLALTGCGLTADFSGLQGGPRDAGGGDANGSAGDAGGDAALETSDGDGAVDAAGGFCASLAAPVHFCDDFDEGQSIGTGWDAVDVYPGSSASVDFTYFSPPASFLSQIASSTGASSGRLQKDLPIGTPHVHVEFEVLVPPTNGNVELCVLHEPVADGTTYGIFYKLVNGNLRLEVTALGDDGGVIQNTYTIGPPPSSWLHVQIDADLSSLGTIVVRHGTTVVVDQTNVDTLTSSRAAMFIELGDYSFDPAQTLAHFDNVVVDWQ